MAFFEVRDGGLQAVVRTSLSKEEVRERRDLQVLLRKQLPELLPDLLVIAEEFGDWDESKRRIDLLAIDRKANLVVIELKRGDTGVHMELQAIRYAAMVSTMTFEQAVSAYAGFLGKGPASDARTRILEHLGWDEPVEDEFAQDVRVVLFSEDFSRELTTSILWLNDKGLDVTAFRVGTYLLDSRLLLEFQQIIPLKEAEEYQVKVRNKQQAEQSARSAKTPWNGEFYVSYGSGRSWEEAVRYGFISGGGGSWYSQTLNLLSPGDRVWVKIPGTGFVGVGLVTEAAQPVDDFMVEVGSNKRRFLDVATDPARYARHADNSENAEFMVRVKWLQTVSEKKAINEVGLFGNQNTVAKPTTPKWAHTVERLKSEFARWDQQ